MQASPFEYRFRYPLHVGILTLGFLAPWLYFGDVLQLETRSLWLVLASWLFRTGGLSFTGATIVLLVLALLLTGTGALLRVWGAAYVGHSAATSDDAPGQPLLHDGPFRNTRNPLYLGTLVHVAGVSLLMPPSGAMFAVAALWLLNVRLALAEETFLRARFGPAYSHYCASVPRFVPTLRAQVPASGQKAHWGEAVLAESYFVAAFFVLAAFGWDFNASPMRRGMLICLGVSLIVRAFLPPTRPVIQPGSRSAA